MEAARAVEAARRPRPRLSRRRPPSGGGLRPGRPWFLRGGGSERDRLWATLLRAATPDLGPAGDSLPPLPAAPGQEPRPGPEAAPPEVFTVGARSFLWTPFPPAPRGAGGLEPHPPASPPSPRRHPTPETPARPSAEELLSEEGPPALGSCPMCQAPFAPTMSQLDVDSHLAQCLAESAEDVAW